jgi:hypothetical protein
MKKVGIVLVGVVVVVGAVVLGAKILKSKMLGKTATTSPTPKPKLTLPANTIPLVERPFVTVEPTAAREVVLGIDTLPKAAESMDFELQYSSAEKEEAAIGSLNIGKLPITKTILLGSQSGGGKITYHESVTGGSLVLSFYNPNYKLSQEWNYIDNRKSLTGFGSKDGKFNIETGKLFKGSAYVIVYNNPGLPKEVKQTVLAGPYSISGTTNIPDGKVTVSIRLPEAKTAALIQTWNGKEWKSYPAKMDGQNATATVDYAGTYVVTEK